MFLRIFYASRAQIFDSKDRISDEVDFVACNEYQPFRDPDGGLFIVEGVDFAIQVKARISSGEIVRAFGNCQTVKALERTWSPGDTVMTKGREASVRERVPYVVIAYTSELAAASLRVRLKEQSLNTPSLDQPDALFVLDPGLAFLNAHDGTTLGWSLDGKQAVGWICWNTGPSTLFELLRFLSVEVSRFKRVKPPIWSYFPKMVQYGGYAEFQAPGEASAT